MTEVKERMKDVLKLKTHWIFDDFSPVADKMRRKIDEHFDEETAKTKPFENRLIWNYWYLDKLYIYMRTKPGKIYPVLHRNFMTQLTEFAAGRFGLEAGRCFLSMYVNGCGQGMHNDAKNGSLAYVFSLTRWEEKGFEGGETLIYKFGVDELKPNLFRASAGQDFYDTVESRFNRLVIFDDRMPHAVRPVQGTMNPADARFVVHGHMVVPPRIAHAEGGLQEIDLMPQWQEMHEPVVAAIKSCGYEGFLTFQVNVEASGTAENVGIKHMQLMPARPRQLKDLSVCIDAVRDIVSHVKWPRAETPSKIVFAITT